MVSMLLSFSIIDLIMSCTRNSWTNSNSISVTITDNNTAFDYNIFPFNDGLIFVGIDNPTKNVISDEINSVLQTITKTFGIIGELFCTNLAKGNDDTIWVIINGFGLVQFDISSTEPPLGRVIAIYTTTEFTNPVNSGLPEFIQNLPDKHLKSVVVNSDDEPIISANGSLYKPDEDEWALISIIDSSNNPITNFTALTSLKDSSGILWFTGEQILLKLNADNIHFTSFDIKALATSTNDWLGYEGETDYSSENRVLLHKINEGTDGKIWLSFSLIQHRESGYFGTKYKFCSYNPNAISNQWKSYSVETEEKLIINYIDVWTKTMLVDSFSEKQNGDLIAGVREYYNNALLVLDVSENGNAIVKKRFNIKNSDLPAGIDNRYIETTMNSLK